MAIRELWVAGYRSVRRMRLALGPINVLTGPNGCGKSNLYNSMFLLARAASGGFARAIAEEGGMPSVLWAGAEGRRLTRKKPPRRVVLGIATDDFRYELQCGLPRSGPPQGGMDREGNFQPESKFLLDPEVKSEWIRTVERRGPGVALMQRDGPLARIRDGDGRMANHPAQLFKSESLLSQIQEPHLYPELSVLRSEMLSWRFYHGFRTDAGSPLRHPQIGVQTPVLSHDGADLAAALETVIETGDGEELTAAVSRAFPGGRIEIACDASRFSILLHMPGILRPLAAPELSDGTLRYLCLIAALLSPRPPALLALNEPETSIHPDLIEPLAGLIAQAARHTQLWITTHSPALAAAIGKLSGEPAIELRMVEGETRADAAGPAEDEDDADED